MFAALYSSFAWGGHQRPAMTTPWANRRSLDGDDLAEHVLKRESPLLEREDAGVADAAGFERAEVGTLQRRGGVDCRGGDHVAQTHAERKELRQRRHLIVGGTVDAERVDVGRDRVGRKTLRHHGATRLPAERTHAMPDVEQNAALARRQHGRLRFAAAVDRRVGERPKGVGQNVARPQPLQHRFIGRAAARRYEPSAVGSFRRRPARRRRAARCPPRRWRCGRA